MPTRDKINTAVYNFEPQFACKCPKSANVESVHQIPTKCYNDSLHSLGLEKSQAHIEVIAFVHHILPHRHVQFISSCTGVKCVARILEVDYLLCMCKTMVDHFCLNEQGERSSS